MKELTLKTTLEDLAGLTAFVDEQLEALGCSVKAQMQIDVAVDELFSNIVHYAYGDEIGEATVRFDYDELSQMVSLAFIDKGVPFDPLQQEDPDVSSSAEERALGGLGIYLVKRTMDRVEYRYENGQNALTIWKRIG